MTPLHYVLDASVGIQLFIQEVHTPIVRSLFVKFATEPDVELHVPDLFFIECANILLKYTRRFNRPLENSLADLHDLQQLMIKSTPTFVLATDALTLAEVKNLSAYDACYAVLAQRLKIPLLTADKRLANSVEWAVWIEEIIP